MNIVHLISFYFYLIIHLIIASYLVSHFFLCQKQLFYKCWKLASKLSQKSQENDSTGVSFW